MLREIVEANSVIYVTPKHLFPKGKDRNNYEPNIAYGTYVKTGKGRLSPNKGKDVYKFKATRDSDAYIKGEFHIGFWELEAGFASYKKVGK